MKVFICGGGTGGHFFSGLATGEDFLKHHPECEIHFVGTQQGIEGRTPLPDARMTIHFISAKGVLGKGIFAKLRGLMALAKGTLESLELLYIHRPDYVLGVGGYTSAPTVFAALLLKWFGIRSTVAILEQNSYAGMANRALKWLGACAYSAFPMPGYQRVLLPLRKSLRDFAQNKRAFTWPPQSLLVVGGSQGAKGLNSKVLDWAADEKEFFKQIKIFHQTGKTDEAHVAQAYRAMGIQAEVFAFSTEMPKFYDSADLIVCRSGAMTVFEVMAFERPAIFVPFPAATHDHQFANASAVQQKDWIVRENQFSSRVAMDLLRRTHPAIPQAALAGDWVHQLLKLRK